MLKRVSKRSSINVSPNGRTARQPLSKVIQKRCDAIGIGACAIADDHETGPLEIGCAVKGKQAPTVNFRRNEAVWQIG